MPTCPFCEGEISATAQKCKHCGEWVRPPPQGHRGQPASRSAYDDADASLGQAANRFVSFQMVMGGIGVMIFLIILFTVFIPMFCTVNRGFGPGGQTLPEGVELP